MKFKWKFPRPNIQKIKRAFTRYGAAGALSLCAIGAAVTIYLTSGTLPRGTDPQVTTQPTAHQAGSDRGQSLHDALQDRYLDMSRNTWYSDAATTAPTATPKGEDTPAGVVKSTSAVPALIRPVPDAQLGMVFAYDILVFQKTLNEWSVHPGVDFKADEGTQVLAALGGMVERVFSDTLMGNCIEISSGNGILCVYASLASLEGHKPGDTIKAGQVIGEVGTSAASEVAEGSHLHFELRLNEKPVDPMPYMQTEEDQS